MLEAALQYAELGYRVFPCAVGAKNPITPNGLLDASSDPAQIEAWWLKTPDANIAISTDGLLVVDIDPMPDGRPNRWLCHEPDKLIDLAAGPLSITPRLGRHYIFKQPAGAGWRNTAGKLAENIDTRADGGYILAAPSVVGRAYQWGGDARLDCEPNKLPEPPAWLCEMLDGSGGNLASIRQSQSQPSNAIPSGQRNSTLISLGGLMRRSGMSQDAIAAALKTENQTRCNPPLPDKEVETIAWSAARYEPDQTSVAVIEDHYGQMTEGQANYDGPEDPGAFPPRLLVVPGLIGRVMEFDLAGAFKPQPVLALGAALALLATLTGRKVTDQYGTRTNLYNLGVCRSGGGKERARQVNKDILSQSGLQHMIGPEGVASHAGLIGAVERNPAILFQLDEIGRMLKTIGNPASSPHLYHIATVLMKLFTSSGSVYIGDAYADSERNKSIQQPHACVYGTTVPNSLYEGLTAENLSDGLLSRMLIFETVDDRTPKQRPIIEQVPQDIIEVARYWGELSPGGNLASHSPKPIVIPIESAAVAIFDALDSESDHFQERLGEILGTLWTRATEKARKLALLYACSENHRAPAVHSIAATWACELSGYLTRRMIYLASKWIAENPFDAKRKRILRVIEAAGSIGISGSELNGKSRWLPTRDRTELIESLVTCGDVVRIEEATGGAPRRRLVAAIHAARGSLIETSST